MHKDILYYYLSHKMLLRDSKGRRIKFNTSLDEMDIEDEYPLKKYRIN